MSTVARYADMFSAMGTEPGFALCSFTSAHPGGLIVGDIQNELAFLGRLFRITWKNSRTRAGSGAARGTFLWYSANTEALQELWDSFTRSAARGTKP
jgi:hypothetical protein